MIRKDERVKNNNVYTCVSILFCLFCLRSLGVCTRRSSAGLPPGGRIGLRPHDSSMADPLACLRSATICIAIWNIIYSLLQFGLLGWQFQVVKNIIAEYENRQLPATGAIDAYQARFPGLYQIYSETPERRRANAMYVIIIVCIIFAIGNFIATFSLLYAAIKYIKWMLWPFLFTSIPLCIMTTVYAVLWWSGDVFNEQLTVSIFEFVMSVAVNSICIIVVIVFYSRLSGDLVSTRPKRSRRRKRKHVERLYVTAPVVAAVPQMGPSPAAAPYLEQPYLQQPVFVDVNRESLFPTPHSHVPSTIPHWRREWPQVPDPQLQQKINRDRRSELRHEGFDIKRTPHEGEQTSLDFYAPEADDPTFPWKMKRLEENLKERRLTQAEKIERLYYQHYPEEVPDLPAAMRKRLRQERDAEETKRRVDTLL